MRISPNSQTPNNVCKTDLAAYVDQMSESVATSERSNTYAREHVSDRGRDLDAQQAGNTEEEAENTGDHAAVQKCSAVPFRGANEVGKCSEFAVQQNERCDDDRGPQICPVRQFNRRVVAVGKRSLDQHGVNGDED